MTDAKDFPTLCTKIHELVTSSIELAYKHRTKSK